MPGWSSEIANEFIRLARKDGTPLTQMQVQKLVFFAHGWCLAITGEPLTHDDPKAFDYGPVYEDLWKALTHYGREPIKKYIKNRDFVPGVFEDNEDDSAFADLSPDELNIIKRVYRDYGKFKAFKLSAITHEEGSPWDEVYNDGEGKFDEIPDEVIRKYFVKLAKRGRSGAAASQ